MPVSSGLQKYFDSRQKKQSGGDTDKKMKDLASQIDPAFMQSFQAFHERILDIVDGDEQASEIVGEELTQLDTQLTNAKRVHNLKKVSAIKQATEK